MVKVTKFELIQLSSKTFLCEEIPDDFFDMSDDDQDNFIESNAWQPFEYWDGTDLYEVIAVHADCIERFLEHKGVKVEYDDD